MAGPAGGVVGLTLMELRSVRREGPVGESAGAGPWTGPQRHTASAATRSRFQKSLRWWGGLSPPVVADDLKSEADDQERQANDRQPPVPLPELHAFRGRA